MSNYEELFSNQMRDPEFAKAYYEARIERIVTEIFDIIKDEILHDEPKDKLLLMLDKLQANIHDSICHADV